LQWKSRATSTPARISASLITVISAWAALYKLSPETLSLIESAPSRQHSRAHLTISAGPSAITAKLSRYMCALRSSPRPPVTVISGPQALSRGPGICPAAIALRITISSLSLADAAL
jgi:hypothetical protein